jgi:urease accessory protein
MNINSNSNIEDLSMMQISDSFFPTGMYATSSGLEALFYSDNKLRDAEELRHLIDIYLEHQIGPADCTALGVAYRCIEDNDLHALIEVDQMVFSMKLIEEVREASVRSGTQLIRCVNYFVSDNGILGEYYAAIKKGRASGIYPVALAIASNSVGVSKNKAGIMMLYSFTVSIVGAALRLGMLQHLDGQKIIHELKPRIIATVKTNIDRPLTSMWQFAPGIDIIQIAHERMTSKMFIT